MVADFVHYDMVFETPREVLVRGVEKKKKRPGERVESARLRRVRETGR